MAKFKITSITFLLLIILVACNFPLNTPGQKIISKEIFLSSKAEVSCNEYYDLLIISPHCFSKYLDPFVAHKNKFNIKTKLVEVEDIYDQMFWQGRDRQEKIKYFIKKAIEKWQIEYVLLVGGRKGQSYNWYIPVRYSRVDDRTKYKEKYFISDLYYADVYKKNINNSYVFEDWDSNGNGIFAEWTWNYNGSSGKYDILDKKDDVDLLPDVKLGRLPCRNAFEVKSIVKKIINYETKTYGKEWFKKMILVAGDTFPETNPNNYFYPFYEGEIETNLSASYMKPLGFDIIKLWSSNNNLNKRRNLINNFDEGAGFIYFSGHGSPITWMTYPVNDNKSRIFGLFSIDIMGLRNREKLPICIITGCNNNKFDVTFLNLFKNPLDALNNMDFVHECWAWKLVNQKQGGAIAAIGSTGLNWVNEGPDCTYNLSGWMNSHFFSVYANLSIQGNYRLGDIYFKTINDYLSNFSTNDDEVSCKTVQEWTLIGDPTLQIGGYQL